MAAEQSVAVDVGSRPLRTSIAPITVFGCSSVVGVGPPTQLNLDVRQPKYHINQEKKGGKSCINFQEENLYIFLLLHFYCFLSARTQLM